MKPETLERIDTCLEGTISEEAFLLLQNDLRQDPTAMDHWLRQAEIHGRLEWELGAHTGTVPLQAQAPAFSRKIRFAAAAIFIAALGAGFFMGNHSRKNEATTVERPPEATPYTGESIARMTSTTSAKWIGFSPKTGSWLSAGKLHLAEGNATVTFDSGASVSLEAPCQVHLLTSNRVSLESGKAVVDIPRQAFGFVFETPSIEISKRMSRFAATVDNGGQAEIHVLEGKIQLAGKLWDLDSLDLGKNHAIRVNREGGVIQGVEYDPSLGGAVTVESPDLLPKWFVHWGFESIDPNAGTFAETGKRSGQELSFPAQVHLAHPDASVSLVPGRYGNSIQLNGQRAFLASGFQGIAGSSPRTISFWVRIHPDTPDTLAYSMLSWGTADHWQGGKWQIGWNTSRDNSGMYGAIRTEVDGGFIVGASDLRTGRWHHVAIVFTGGEGADISTHVRHYIDGRLEPSTAANPKQVHTNVNGKKSVPVTIGRRIEQDGYYQTFSGEIDEVYIFPSALTPAQIENLYLKNEPPKIRSN